MAKRDNCQICGKKAKDTYCDKCWVVVKKRDEISKAIRRLTFTKDIGKILSPIKTDMKYLPIAIDELDKQFQRRLDIWREHVQKQWDIMTR